MPHIVIKCYSGRSEEVKKEAARKVAEAASLALGSDISNFSVDIIDIEKEDWKEKVYDKEIKDKKLYVEPSYKM